MGCLPHQLVQDFFHQQYVFFWKGEACIKLEFSGVALNPVELWKLGGNWLKSKELIKRYTLRKEANMEPQKWRWMEHDIRFHFGVIFQVPAICFQGFQQIASPTNHEDFPKFYPKALGSSFLEHFLRGSFVCYIYEYIHIHIYTYIYIYVCIYIYIYV